MNRGQWEYETCVEYFVDGECERAGWKPGCSTERLKNMIANRLLLMGAEHKHDTHKMAREIEWKMATGTKEVARPRDIKPMVLTRHDPEQFDREYRRCVDAVASEVWWLASDLWHRRVKAGVAHFRGEGNDYRQARDVLEFIDDVVESIRHSLERESFELAEDRDTA